VGRGARQPARRPGVVVADVDPARIAGVRASLPALRHRKIS
jgi:nitrilase